MLLPLLLIGLAMGAAAMIAYGTSPGLAQHAHGLELIMAARRLEWPLITISLLLCVALLGLVIAGRKSAWWLIGLAPILALFMHRFAPPGERRLYVLDPPVFVQADHQPSPRDHAWVVGVVFEDQAYALPYAALYSAPVVFITDYDKRMMVMWSAHANRAVAVSIAREFKPRDLEIVTAPANTLLLYDRRLGQFIVALTGQMVDGGKPIGFGQFLTTTKTTWSVWRKLHPSTNLLSTYEVPGAPSVPILPVDADRMVDGLPAKTVIAMVGGSPPAAILSESLGKVPLNTKAGHLPLLVVRDPSTQRLRVFDRSVKEDLFPRFTFKSNRRHPEVAMTDPDSNSWWTIDGKAIDGPLKGAQLKELPVEEDLYWGAMKFWYPQTLLVK